MATREDRMRQRLRGAVRHQVEDISFGFVLPEAEEDEHTDTSDRIPSPDSPTPNTATPTKTQRTSTASLQKQSDRSSSPVLSTSVTVPRSDPAELQSDEDRQRPDVGPEDDDVTALLPPVAKHSTGSRRSRRSATSRLSRSDVVEESPANAPGSGHRISMDEQEARNSARKLRSILESMGNEDPVMNSSPLARKSRRSTWTASPSSQQKPRRARLSKTIVPPVEEIDELSPNATRTMVDGVGLIEEVDDGESNSVLGRRRSGRNTSGGHAEGTGEAGNLPILGRKRSKRSTGSDRAEGIDDAEAARILGQKRPQRSPARASSPLLEALEQEVEAEADDLRSITKELSLEPSAIEGESTIEEEPPPKRRKRKRLQASPAKQKQPSRKKEAVQKRRQAKSAPTHPEDTSADEMGIDETAIVTVQRFTRPLKHQADDGEVDILASEIPFGNQKGVNVVDVLAQSCEEVFNPYLDKLRDAIQNAEESSVRKELRVKLKALEAFAEEARTRLLTHTIMLDNLQSLRQRVKEAEMARSKLRDSILERRKEQEDVHLRIDAEREAHDENRRLLATRLEMSSGLHAIRQAVEQGRRENESLIPNEAVKANLAMLELTIPNIADKVCAKSGQGGLIQRVVRFNNFLERAATELERPKATGVAAPG